MLAQINPAALPALRIAGAFFLTVNILAFVYFFRNRHRFFDKDPNIEGDIPAVRKLRVEVILVPWFFLTTYLLVLLIYLWME
jgi:hypothetical protein